MITAAITARIATMIWFSGNHPEPKIRALISAGIVASVGPIFGTTSQKPARIPKSNVSFWTQKIMGNSARDKVKIENLEALGWRVFCVWECQLNHPEQTLSDLVSKLKSL